MVALVVKLSHLREKFCPLSYGQPHVRLPALCMSAFVTADEKALIQMRSNSFHARVSVFAPGGDVKNMAR